MFSPEETQDVIKVRSYAIRDRKFENWQTEVEGRWTYRDLLADQAYRNDWVSLDCLAWHARDRALYVGLTAMSNDIFYRFDADSGHFESLGFSRVADQFDAKFHRALEVDSDGAVWGATALLHDQDDQSRAAGGKIVRYLPDSGELRVAAVPVPHHYIQSIKLDPVRRVIYGFTYPGEIFFAFDLDSNTTREIAFIGNSLMICQPHGFAIDGSGAVWGTWGETRAFEDHPGPEPIRLFRYDPDTREVEYFRHGLPRIATGDRGNVDHMILGSDGDIWVGTAAGVLARIATRTGDVTYVGKPFPGKRLAGVVEASDGYIYLAGNSGYDDTKDGSSRLARLNPDSRSFEDLGPIRDEEREASAAKVHMMVEGEPGRLYCGEDDNIYRSSYLWRIDIPSVR